MNTEEEYAKALELFQTKFQADYVNLIADINISENEISSDMVEHAAKKLHYQRLSNEWKGRVDSLTLVLSTETGKVTQALENACPADVRAKTGWIEARVKTNVGLVNRSKLLNAVKQMHRDADSVNSAFRGRESMLIRIGKLMETERRPDVIIRAAQQEREQMLNGLNQSL